MAAAGILGDGRLYVRHWTADGLSCMHDVSCVGSRQRWHLHSLRSNFHWADGRREFRHRLGFQMADSGFRLSLGVCIGALPNRAAGFMKRNALDVLAAAGCTHCFHRSVWRRTDERRLRAETQFLIFF